MSVRSLEQNALMWARLTDIANQLPWPVDGKTQHLSPSDWKDICTAGLRKTQRIAQGIEGGFVVLGARTSKMTVAEMKELLDFIEYVGGTYKVQWSKQPEAPQ